MLAKITSSELTEWMAYFLMEKAEADTPAGQTPAQQIARLKAAGHG